MICVVPLSTMPAWADTFNNWTPDVNYVIYTGREEARSIIRDKELLVDGNTKKIKFNVRVMAQVACFPLYGLCFFG